MTIRSAEQETCFYCPNVFRNGVRIFRNYHGGGPESSERFSFGTYNDFPYESSRDEWGHGTAVAGIIGAEADNGYGISGICHNCSIRSYKVWGNMPETSDEPAYYNAFYLAIADGADIINYSGGISWSSGVQGMSYAHDAVSSANDAGVLINLEIEIVTAVYTKLWMGV